MGRALKTSDEEGLNWIEEDEKKAQQAIQSNSGPVNPKAKEAKEGANKGKNLKPKDGKKDTKEKDVPPKQIELFPRGQKNFRPTTDRIQQFDFLEGCASMTGKKGPELIDEALDFLFKQYPNVMGLYKEFKQQKPA